MGWLIAVLVALAVLGALALAVPAVFGVVLGGLLPRTNARDGYHGRHA